MKSCLIVDDSRVIRKVSRHIVETLGFTVDEAADGQEALAKCESKMPDVILLDQPRESCADNQRIVHDQDADGTSTLNGRPASGPPEGRGEGHAPVLRRRRRAAT